MLYEPDPEVKKQKDEAINTVDLPKFFKIMDARVARNSNKHFIAGEQLTIADILLVMLGSAAWFNSGHPVYPKF